MSSRAVPTVARRLAAIGALAAYVGVVVAVVVQLSDEVGALIAALVAVVLAAVAGWFVVTRVGTARLVAAVAAVALLAAGADVLLANSAVFDVIVVVASTGTRCGRRRHRGSPRRRPRTRSSS
jgi:hypothetical protein